MIAKGLSRLTGVACLLAGGTANAQDAPSEPAPAVMPADAQIVVTADRYIVAALRGIAAEREYDETDVASYGISTVGEFVDEVMGENGDDEAIFLIDGEPVSGIDDVSDFPAEAVERLEVLPRGSGQRIGREADRRVYNVVLKKQLRSLTLTTSREEATEGAWGQSNGETIGSRIAGRERLNLTLRVRDSDRILESDRNIVQPVPGSAIRPADYYAPIDAGAFRTLRAATTNFEASLIGGKPLAPGVTTSFSVIGRIGRDRSLSGLPYLLFQLPGSSPYAPVPADQTLLLFGPSALTGRSERKTLNGNATVNANRGAWFATLTGQFNLADQDYLNDRLDYSLITQPIAVPGGRNPYTDPLSEYFVTQAIPAASQEQGWLVKLNAGAPLLQLPAGMMRMRASVQRDGNHSRSDNGIGPTATSRIYRRSATRFDGGIDIPLASRQGGFLPALGELTLSLDRGHDVIDRRPDLDRSSISALWQPSPRVSVSALAGKVEELPPVETIADPVVVYDNARVFDFLTGETVEVSVIAGGNPALRPLSKVTRRLSFSGALWQRYSLQFNLDYEANILRDFVAGIPASSTSIFLAFPERFLRDSSGRLVTVDSRPTNFERESRRELRYSFSFLIPLEGSSPTSGDGNAAVASFQNSGPGSRARLQVTASHTIALKDEIVLRDGLPVVDLLKDGALGIGGGRPRHFVNGSMTFSKRGYGLRLTGQYRSGSALIGGTAALPERLRFAPIFTASLRAFTDLEPLVPGSSLLKDSRLTVTVENAGNRRQTVRDAVGLTPLRYQPGYRDPVGRTFAIELRKVF